MLYYSQRANDADSVVREIVEVVAQGTTKYQSYLFFKSAASGVCIALDGDVQSTEIDEPIYHEALVHPALLLHPNPRKVLIMGGGEGSTSREVLRHKNVEKVVMVDIDEEFVELCKTHIPSWADGCFDDPRHHVRYEDIRQYVLEADDKFDVVIGDLVDVSASESVAVEFYSLPFYEQLANCLNEGAILSTQGGPLSTSAMPQHNRIRHSLRKAIGSVHSYGQVVPSFYGMWGFIIGGAGLGSMTRKDIEAKILSAKQQHNFDPPAIGIDALARGFFQPASIARRFS